MTKIEILKQIERKILWFAIWMIHHANNIRTNEDEIKVGGHQASSTSLVSILTALYFSELKPEDRVAIKPHASPAFHAVQYLVNNISEEQLKNFRGIDGVQSYPSRTKDVDDVDFSTGSVGLGVAFTSMASLIQDYIISKKWGKNVRTGRMISILGDAELDEGNIYECLHECWKHDLRNNWWIVDYNRQSLDGIVREGLAPRLKKIFEAFGWQVIEIKFGAEQRKVFAEPGGGELRNWIENCSNEEYSALTFLGADSWRERLNKDLANHADTLKLINQKSDHDLIKLMTNLGGHCVETLTDTFQKVDHENPVCFIAYTIKGWGTPIAGHKDNHGGLITSAQMDLLKKEFGYDDGDEWNKYSGITNVGDFKSFLNNAPFFQVFPRRYSDMHVGTFEINGQFSEKISTQAAFGKILSLIAKSDSALNERLLTISPDVSGTTSLGAWVNSKKLFSRKHKVDIFKDQNIPSTARWEFGPDGQHFELGIAEMNMFLLLGAAGLSHSLWGKRILPIGTVYDPFISRGLDALNYACYQDSRFMLVGTPSGTTLAPEGGAHQSIATPLIGMSQSGLLSFEPAFADELVEILKWSFDYMQANTGNDTSESKNNFEQNCEDGGSVYLRLSTLPIEQVGKRETSLFKNDVVNGGYWLRKPGPNCEIVIIYQGVIVPEVLQAVGYLSEYRRDIGVMAVTSADRLHRDWRSAINARKHGNSDAKAHIELLLEGLQNHIKFYTVLDGHPATLSWLGGVNGNQTFSLGVDDFGKSGQVCDLYRTFGIDAKSIVELIESTTVGRPRIWAA